MQTRRKKKLRAISARNLENAITRLYGFLVNVRPGLASGTDAEDIKGTRSLLDLVTPDRVLGLG